MMTTTKLETMTLTDPRWKRGARSAAGSVAGALEALVTATGFGERDERYRQLAAAVWAAIPVSWRPRADELAERLAELAREVAGDHSLTTERSRRLRTAMGIMEHR